MRTRQVELMLPLGHEQAARSTLLVSLVLFASLHIVGCGGEAGEGAEPSDSALVDTAAIEQATGPATTGATRAGTIGSDLAGSVDSLGSRVALLESRVDRLGSNEPDDPLSLLQEPAEVRSGQEGLDAQRRVQETAQDVQNFTLRAIWAVIILVAALLFIRGAVWLLGVLSEQSVKRRLLFKKLIPIVRLVVWALVIFYVVSAVFEVDRAGLLAGTAAVGVGIGFAAQGVLKNVFGGLIIIFDQPFQVGDKISVGGTYGEVVSIGMRATRIVTPDDNLVSVPNSQVVEGQVANANAGALDCQVVVHLYVPGWVDVRKAKAIALSAAMNSQYVYLDKPVVVNVKDEFDRIFLTHLMVKAYVIDTRYEFALASDVTEAAKAEFIRQGMIPVMTADLDQSILRPAVTGESVHG